MKKHFRTEINLKKGLYPALDYQSRIFLIGSCFSDEIGNKFQQYKFNVLSNPFGVTYNPISIKNQLSRIAGNQLFNAKDFFEKDESYNSFELHGSFDRMDKTALLIEINHLLEKSLTFLKRTSHLYITLGTAWVYELKKSGTIVNNCHKRPSSEFSKRLLNIEEVVSAMNDVIRICKKINPGIKFIFTLSPVRHLKDGFAENSLSKSILRVAIAEMEKKDHCYYFPSNEMLNDDLRDYRFYDSDMLHPNDMAVDYIWSHMKNAQINDSNQLIMAEIENLIRSIEHKPFNELTEAHKRFVNATLLKAEQLHKKHQEIDLSKEISALKKRLLAE